MQAGGSALLALPAPPSSNTPLAIPPALTPPHQVGTVALVVHNPGELPVRVWSAAGTEPTATIPAHGTAQIELAAPAGSEAQPQATLETDGPLSAYFLLTIDSHRAALSPATAGSPLWFTAIVGESRRFVATSVALQNPTPTPLPIVATLLDDQGQVRDERRLTLCGRCISSVRLDFTDDDGTLSDADGAIVVRADSPLIASATQLTTQTQSFYHAWGLALPLVPGVAIAGVLGALLTIAGCGALLMAQLYGLVRDSGISRQVAIVTILALGLASPILTYSLQLYPEIPALLLLITGLRLALGALPLRGWRLIAAAVCTLTIPLLHARLLPLAAV
ncbi:MAG TPA: hypothetical protein VFH51_16240, partial [Myxococcota bacterium]|nr:hypothetical protein [Myxococcota bacterium]